MREGEHVATPGRGAGREVEELLGSRIDLSRRLAPGASVVVDLPAWPRISDLRAGQAFVLAVAELSKQVGDLRIWESSELRRSACALHRARENSDEVQSGQPSSKRGRPLLSTRRQGQVGLTGMPAVEAPIGLAVTGEVDG